MYNRRYWVAVVMALGWFVAVNQMVCGQGVAATAAREPAGAAAVPAAKAVEVQTAPAPMLETEPPVIYREGFSIVNRRAKFIKHPVEQRWFLALDAGQAKSLLDTPIEKNVLDTTAEKPEKFDWVIEILPCKWLTAMNFVTDLKDNLNLTFRVWGSITEYKSRNFVLLTLVATEKVFDVPEAKPAAGAAAMGGLDTIMQSMPRKKTEEQDLAVRKLQIEQMTEKLRADLMKMPRPELLELPPYVSEPLPVSEPAAGEQAPAAPPLLAKKWKDGQAVLDREGRVQLNIQSGQFFFLFDSDGKLMESPPVILQPCRLLEEMETIASNATQPLRFRISGMVSKFQGKDYLVLQKMFALYNERRSLPR